MEIIDVENIELYMDAEKRKYVESRGNKYRYSAYDSYNAILKKKEIINFLDLEEIYGHENREKYGEYRKRMIYVPEHTITYVWEGLERAYSTGGYNDEKIEYTNYNRNELIERYFDKTNDNELLKSYLNNLDEDKKRKLSDSLIDYSYAFNISYYPFKNSGYEFLNKYYIHNKYCWEQDGKYLGEFSIKYDNIIKMRNTFARIVQQNNLTLSQAIIFSILFPELISNKHFSKLVSTEDKNFSILKFKNFRMKKEFGELEAKYEKEYAIEVNQKIIDCLKKIFDEDYIFNLSPIEAYSLKNKYEFLVMSDLLLKYPNVTKQNLIKLLVYVKDYDELEEYLDVMNNETNEIQKKLLKVIEPFSSKESITSEYTDDEIYNVINYVNYLSFITGYKIGTSYEKVFEEYKDELKSTTIKGVTNEDKGYTLDMISNITIHTKSNITSAVKIYGDELDLIIKLGILSMNPYFVDAFETFFKDKIDEYRKILKLDDREKILDELLVSKNDVLKYAYTEPFVSKSDYDKMMVAKSFLDKYFEYRIPKSIIVDSEQDVIEENNSKRLIKKIN